MFSESAADAVSAAAPTSVRRQRVVGGSTGKLKSYFRADSGAEAIDLSRAIGRYKRETVAGQKKTDAVRHIGKRVFYRIDGQWIDSAYKKEMKTRRIAFACDDYFKLLDDHPELKPCLALGERIIVVLDGTAILIEVAP